MFVTVCVAAVRGGTVEPEPGDWPDAWIVDGAERIPVEVVTAVERPPDENPESGSAVLAKLSEVQREADRLTAEDGRGRIVGAHPVGPNAAEGWMIEFGEGKGKGKARQPGDPPDPARAILTAARQKIGKSYGPSSDTVLIADWACTSIFQLADPPTGWDLTSVGTRLTEEGCNFREVWAVIIDDIERKGRAERLFPPQPGVRGHSG